MLTSCHAADISPCCQQGKMSATCHSAFRDECCMLCHTICSLFLSNWTSNCKRVLKNWILYYKKELRGFLIKNMCTSLEILHTSRFPTRPCRSFVQKGTNFSSPRYHDELFVLHQLLQGISRCIYDHKNSASTLFSTITFLIVVALDTALHLICMWNNVNFWQSLLQKLRKKIMCSNHRSVGLS